MRSTLTISPASHRYADASMWLIAFALMAISWFFLINLQIHLLVAFAVAVILFAIGRVNKPIAVVCTITFLFIMGDLRRVLALLAPQPAYDPLLLIGPGMALWLALPILAHVKLREGLSASMLVLLLVMALEIFNPLQGGISVGLSGAFFYITPVLWFWVGRGLGSPSVVEQILYKVLLPLAMLAACLGLCQTFIGFLPYQQSWINLVAGVYRSLHLGNSIRAFGFSISAAEYATLLVFGSLIVVVGAMTSSARWLILLPPLATALVLASGRGVIIRFVVTLSVTWCLRHGRKLKPANLFGILFLCVLSLAVMTFVASRFSPEGETQPRNTTAAQSALSHQLGGLGHPFDKRYSTAGTHTNMAVSALTRGLTHPVGFGLGFTTFAAQKLVVNPAEGSSEVDFTDMFLALGAVGGMVYLVVALIVLRDAATYVQTTSRRISLPVFAIILTTLGAWLVGGQYSTSSLLFFLFGSLVYKKNLPFVAVGAL